jgi:(1->4)-alpha-D-glucan 1-alpha-D-glucosylmutase
VSTVTSLVALATLARAKRRPTPLSTYRVQFHAGFTLADGIAQVPYWANLGVSHLYASPILKARPGSNHGYDVTDHGELNPEVGTPAELDKLAADLHAKGLGMVLDVVPNHMSVGGGNGWWVDVLEHGPASPYAGYFDIAWDDSPRPTMAGRLLLPVLGEQYGVALENGDIKPLLEEGAFSFDYHGNRLPADPRTYDRVLAPASAALTASAGVDDPAAVELASVLNAVKNLPPRGETDPERIALARAECAVVKRRIAEFAERFPAAADAVEDALERFEGPENAEALDEWLEAQAYRPCFWRVATDEVNYRRFFDVNDLAALSTERDDVFRAVHRKWLQWVGEGKCDGLRIDHPDGLFDPEVYLDRLQQHSRLAVAKAAYDADPEAYPGVDWSRDEGPLLELVQEGPGDSLYVVVEKILAENEPIPDEWATAGSTGYEFLAFVNGLFVDPAGETPLSQFYRDLTGDGTPWGELIYRTKRQVMQSTLAGEVNALAYRLDRLARRDRRTRDFTLNGIRKALREVIACFPAYRSYVTEGGVHDADKALVGKACHRAYRRNVQSGRAIFDFVRDTVTLKPPRDGDANPDYRAEQARFAGKFQQVTAPVTAKGVEDTAFYVFHRLTSLNEVGGEPGHFGHSPAELHKFLTARAAEPGGLSPLSTHDTKRSEDVRARLNVLSEVPQEWADCVRRWQEWNRPHKTEGDGGVLSPDANEEYLFYQSVVGAWPFPAGKPVPADGLAAYRERLQAYMSKAISEAKVNSSWINPDADYEAALTKFIDATLSLDTAGEFVADVAAFVGRIAPAGYLNGLAQTALRCAAPGVPDTYQGMEFWDFSLVDPDNRRPVNYTARAKCLAALDEAAATPEGTLAQAEKLAADIGDPAIKMLVTSRLLRLRNELPDLFRTGSYEPMLAEGAAPERVFAFARRHGNARVIVAVPRLTAKSLLESQKPADRWAGVSLPLPEGFEEEFRHLFTGEAVTPAQGLQSLPVGDLFARFPVAVLVRRDA